MCTANWTCIHKQKIQTDTVTVPQHPKSAFLEEKKIIIIPGANFTSVSAGSDDSHRITIKDKCGFNGTHQAIILNRTNDVCTVVW